MKLLAVLTVFVFTLSSVAPAAATELSRVTVIPETYGPVVTEAYRSLPPRLREALANGRFEVVFRNGDALGAALASDAFGMELPVQSVYVRWPTGAETVSFPWGEIRLKDATRHELAHLALERIWSKNSALWVELGKALRDEGPEFLEKATLGHRGAAYLYSPSAMAQYESLHEYLASLIEHCGKPVRMPLPSGRARPMVEALVLGGDCS